MAMAGSVWATQCSVRRNAVQMFNVGSDRVRKTSNTFWGEKAWKTRDLSFGDVFNPSIRRHHIWQNKYMMKSNLKRSFTSRCDIRTNVEAITTARSSFRWWEITRLRDLYDFSQVWIHSFHNANLSFFLNNLILISTSPSHPLPSHFPCNISLFFYPP